MYVTKMYCIFLNERTGKALVRSVYMIPVLALASAAKQNMSCMAHASCVGNMQLTSAWARSALSLSQLCCVDDVFARWCCIMWPLLVAVDCGR